jgi:hypothetical protein
VCSGDGVRRWPAAALTAARGAAVEGTMWMMVEVVSGVDGMSSYSDIL